MKIQRIVFSSSLVLPAAILTACGGGGHPHTPPAPALRTAFSYTGSDQTYTVPAGIKSLYVKLWGAGGGISGGSGAYVYGKLKVVPGETLVIVVGGSSGGVYYSPGPAARSYGGGGTCSGISDVLAGVGGGRSAIRRAGFDIVTAGAGGGGSYVTIGAHARRGGGGGGLAVGGSPEAGTATGGTQTAGGSMNAISYQGGDPSGGGGGGGGGFFGGGGGSGANPSSYTLYPGAGGSSLTANLTFVVASPGAVGDAVGAVAGGSTDIDYVAGIGKGGGPNGGAGGAGRVIVSTGPF